MKQTVKIFSDLKFNNFFLQIFKNNIVELNNINDINKTKDQSNCTIIFLSEEYNLNKNIIKKFDNNCLIISNNKNLTKADDNNVNIVTPPVSPNTIKNFLDKTLLNKILKFGDIEINEKFINNFNNDKSCFLTEIESQILTHLFEVKSCKRSFLKKNILNIKSNIETNSLDSHLTRIRKKLESIKTNVSVVSKNDVLTLVLNSKE